MVPLRRSLRVPLKSFILLELAGAGRQQAPEVHSLSMWRIVTERRPDKVDYPVTVVRSTIRNRAVWRPYVEVLTDADREVVSAFFDPGEVVRPEDWFGEVS